MAIEMQLAAKELDQQRRSKLDYKEKEEKVSYGGTYLRNVK